MDKLLHDQINQAENQTNGGPPKKLHRALKKTIWFWRLRLWIILAIALLLGGAFLTGQSALQQINDTEPLPVVQAVWQGFTLDAEYLFGGANDIIEALPTRELIGLIISLLGAISLLVMVYKYLLKTFIRKNIAKLRGR